jgi:hypothetical protein
MLSVCTGRNGFQVFIAICVCKPVGVWIVQSAMWSTAGRLEFDFWQGKIFHFSTSSWPALGPTQPPIHRVSGALSPGIKRSGREVDHSSLTNAGDKIM